MNSFDIIHILAAGIKQLPSGKWVSTDLTEEDNKLGSPGGKLHISAGAMLTRSLPEAFIFTGGGKGYGVTSDAPHDRPPLSRILSDELVEAGVPIERIVLEHNSNNTYQELQELEWFMLEHSGQRVAIITGRWHVGRVNMMLQVKFPGLISKEQISVVSAEEVLLADNPDVWEALISAAYRSKWMKKRLEIEELGVSQIVAGTYRFQ